MFKRALCVLLAWTMLWPPALVASTQAGELIVIEVDPESGTLICAIAFMEYFSAPGEFMPGMRWVSRQKGSPFADRTMWMIDGRPVHWQVGAAALEPGDHIYHYGSRHTTEFINLNSHERVTVGELQGMTDGKLNLMRLMVRRYDTDAAVYQRYHIDVADDARYLFEGEPSDAATVLQDGHFIRVLPAQQQIISTFTDEALLTVDQYHESHSGVRQGRVLGEAREGKHSGVMLQLADGSEIFRGIDRKGYAVLDGNYLWSRRAVTKPGTMFAMGSYRGWERAKYVLSRSQAMDALDGRIESIEGSRVQVRLDGTHEIVTVTLNAEALIQLNGLEVAASEALVVGRAITVFNQRPQVIDAWSIGQPTPGYDPPHRKTGIQYAIIEYTPEGERRVLQDGYNPYFDSPKVEETPPPVTAGPPGHHELTREEAMQVWTGS